MTTPTIPILLDTDPGIDDAIALFALLALDHVELVGVTTVFGNASVEQTTRNARALLGLAERNDIPVFRGAPTPLSGDLLSSAALVHGRDGLGNTGLSAEGTPHQEESAADALIRISHEYSGSLRIVAIGPLTNLAAALEQDPTVAVRIHSVTIMGGAALTPGNVTAVAEANIFADPEAAAQVLEAAWTTIVAPLDVTLSHPYTTSQREELLASQRCTAQTVGRMLPVYFRFYRDHAGSDSIFLHDAVAALLAADVLHPTDARTVPTAVATDAGIARGALVADLRRGQPGYRGGRGVSTIILAVAEPVSAIVQQLLVGAPDKEKVS